MAANTIGFQRSAMIGGPCKIVTGASPYAFWSDGTIHAKLNATTRELKTNIHGRIDERYTDALFNVDGFTPVGMLANLSTLLPSYCTAPVIGQRLFTDVDVPWKLWGNNGDLLTITSCAVIQPPSLTLGNGDNLFGPMRLVGVVGNGLNPKAANSYYKLESAQADPGGVFTPSNFREQLYTAAWGAVTGFTAFSAQDRWTITFSPTWEPVKVQGWTIDYKLTSMMVTAQCQPFGPTAAQLYAAAEEFAAGGSLGDKSVGDLTFTGDDGTTVISLNNMALKERGLQFGAIENRIDPLTWVNIVEFSAGVAADIAVLPAV